MAAMANPEHLVIARNGATRWNQWHGGNPPPNPDFSGIDFRDTAHKAISFEGFLFGDNARFDGCQFGDGTSFKKAKFGKNARFDECSFGDVASFEKAQFGDGARFDNCTFTGAVDFVEAQFGAEASFRSAAFTKATSFSKAHFGRSASFLYASFLDDVRFDGVQFQAFATFKSASFGRIATFSHARFAAQTSFSKATFASNCHFNEAQLLVKSGFDGATFIGPANFAASTKGGSALVFGAVDFSDARFRRPASFAGRDFGGEADFSNAHFFAPPDFRGTQNREHLNWTGTRFAFSGEGKFLLWSVPTPSWTTQSSTAAGLRRLRAIASEMHAVDAERDLFVLERQAECGILWKNWWNDATWPEKIVGWWKPFSATALMTLYRISSNCGRSVALPLLWLAESNVSFYYLYGFLIDRPLFLFIRKALLDFTLASAIPFSATARPVYQAAIEVLFRTKDSNLLNIPWSIQAASASQGVLNVVLAFLLALALRNHFKLR